jgi:hypothetical protein
MLRNIAEERRSHSQGDGSLKSIREAICLALEKQEVLLELRTAQKEAAAHNGSAFR